MTIRETATKVTNSIVTVFTKRGYDLAAEIRKYEAECYGKEIIMETRLGWVKGIVVAVTWDDTVMDRIAQREGGWLYTLRFFGDSKVYMSAGSQQTVGADGFLFTGKYYSNVDKVLPVHPAYQ